MLDQPDHPYQPEEPEEPEETDQPRLTHLPFVTPGDSHMISRTGAEFLAQKFNDSNGGANLVDVHFYDGNNVNYHQQSIPGPSNPLRFVPNVTLRPGNCSLHYRFRVGTWWTVWYRTGWFVAVEPPIITDPPVSNNVLTSPTPLIKGSGQVGYQVQLIRGTDNAPLSGSVSVGHSGGWELRVTTPLVGREHTISVLETLPGYGGSARAANRNFVVSLPAPPTITSPKTGDVLRELRPTVSGTGSDGATVTVFRQGGTGGSYGSASVVNGKWDVKLTQDLPEGGFVFHAQGTLSGGDLGWSNLVTVTVLYPAPNAPTITEPGPGTVQNQTFTISGAGGATGATVEILDDFGGHTVINTGPVKTGGRWDVPVTVPPGAKSLVAEQFIGGGEHSRRSAPRFFRIRPAKLTGVTVTALDNEEVKLSGAGYTGATVEITKISGPGAAVLPTVVVKDGSWAVTAKNWVPGNYVLLAIQKVPDSPSGWIPSEDYQFTVTWALPIPTEVTYTKEYTPTFSGKGYTGATVHIAFPGGSVVAPEARVVNGAWSSKASQVWGPTDKRRVELQQRLNDQASPDWVGIEVTIPPLAPDITSIVDSGLSPTITGTCWPGAVVELTYSGSATKYKPTVTNGTWTYRRDDPFAHDVTHTVTVTQTAASQTSESASKTFTIPLPQLVITSPVPGQNEEVSRDLVVKGNNGVKGATVKIRDALYNRDLGSSGPLSADGAWLVSLDKPLDFGPNSIDAIQSNSVRESVPSEVCTFKVVVLPPTFEVPLPGGDLPRISIISGKGLPDARVSVWRQGHDVPLLREILVDKDGHWEGRVELFLVREIVIWATQTFGQQTSEKSPLLTCNVVPNAPDMETPAPGEFVQDEVVCAGFGYTDNTGDMVTVALADEPQTVLGQAQVLADRSWSMRITLARPGGLHKLIAVQSRDGFASAPSPERLIRLGSFQPQVNEPAEGRWVTEPIACEGEGQNGVGEVVAWFNPELKLADDIPSTEAGWKATIKEKLRPGGHRVCFQQRLEGGTVLSRWAESPRFEVDPPKPPSE